MTLCAVWKYRNKVHFASDSRVTIDKNSYADIGIKVLSLPYNIFSPTDSITRERSLDLSGELGMCFAGSAVNSLFIKESVGELLKELQYVPGESNVNMDGLARIVFKAYRIISSEICKTAIGGNGRAALVIAGWCIGNKSIRTFILETNDQNQHSCREILTANNQCHFIGSGRSTAESRLPINPSNLDYLKILKSVIDDSNIPSVGGPIQYGCFEGNKFRLSGVVALDDEVENVRYWRGALDINSPDFIGDDDVLIPGFKFIDPFKELS